MSEEFHDQLMETLEKTENANKEFVKFMKIKGVKSFPYRTTIDGFEIGFDTHLKVTCSDCDNNKELCLKRTVVKDFASCMEVWTLGYCVNCYKWVSGRSRFYPRENRYMIFVNGAWINGENRLSLWDKICAFLGFGK